jgi:membrane-bound lytic murein transglycosylase D
MTHWFNAVSVALGFLICANAALATQPSVSASSAGTSSVSASTPAAPELRISYTIAGSSVVSENKSGNLWDRIRTGFKLPDSNPSLTQSHARAFTKHPDNFGKTLERSRLYLYFIAEEVEKRGMPMEIALLPIIESAFIPTAVSPAKASGIWQFMPSTGKVFGLSQNGWYDGRYDVHEATHAALDYLQKLHGMFGNWELALAAYNCGEGCVGRAMKRSGINHYAGLSLPAETRNYVPKLIAIRNIISDPAAYGVKLNLIPNEPYFLPISLPRPIEAATAAKLAEMSIEDFTALNPGFKRKVIYTASRNVLLLPVDRVQTFQFNMHRNGMEKGTLQTYSAKKGESLASIANRFNVSLGWLRSHNPVTATGSRTQKAQEIVVPKLAVAEAQKPSATTPKAPRTTPTTQTPSARNVSPAPRTHTVQRGETLFKLARTYNVKVADIQRLNADIIPRNDRLKPGMEIEIPSSAAG